MSSWPRPRRLLLPILQFDLGQMYPGLWWPAWTFDGGANLAGLKLTLNFLEVPPFHDRCDFWKTMKEIYSEWKMQSNSIQHMLPSFAQRKEKNSTRTQRFWLIDWKENIKSYDLSSDNTLPSNSAPWIKKDKTKSPKDNIKSYDRSSDNTLLT